MHSDVDVAWAAGVICGDGSISVCVQPKSTWMKVAVAQSGPEPPEILLRMRDIFGGRITGPNGHKGPNRQPRWQWELTRFAMIEVALDCMWPYLTEVKRDQAVRALNTYRSRPLKRRP
jgi:hypothetical protein